MEIAKRVYEAWQRSLSESTESKTDDWENLPWFLRDAWGIAAIRAGELAIGVERNEQTLLEMAEIYARSLEVIGMLLHDKNDSEVSRCVETGADQALQWVDRAKKVNNS